MRVLYERDPYVGNGFGAYRGHLESDYHQSAFEGEHFDALLRRLHAALQEADNTLVFIRLDRPELGEYVLPEQLLTLIKVDVEKAIEAMRVPDIRISVRDALPASSLETCGDTLAATFGDSVSCSYRERSGELRVECPVCGKWAYTFGQRLHCDCGSDLPYTILDTLWACVRVADLLQTSHSRFFLPRKWNATPPWVTRKDLHDRYTQYLHNKELL